MDKEEWTETKGAVVDVLQHHKILDGNVPNFKLLGTPYHVFGIPNACHPILHQNGKLAVCRLNEAGALFDSVCGAGDEHAIQTMVCIGNDVKLLAGIETMIYYDWSMGALLGWTLMSGGRDISVGGRTLDFGATGKFAWDYTPCYLDTKSHTFLASSPSVLRPVFLTLRRSNSFVKSMASFDIAAFLSKELQDGSDDARNDVQQRRDSCHRSIRDRHVQ